MSAGRRDKRGYCQKELAAVLSRCPIYLYLSICVAMYLSVHFITSVREQLMLVGRSGWRNIYIELGSKTKAT